ncbi:MAG: TraB/GumN family protein [Muribaculaceae bacterium]|nr:TraB/GumN family protein [Muribaculaceae bacterium]
MFKKIFFILTLTMLVSTSVSAQLLYKIEGPNAEKPSYIFGSHHLSPISIVEESGVMEYFDQTDQVVGEIDLTQDPMVISMAIQQYMTAPADSTLSVLLKGENLDSLNIQFEKWAPMPGMKLQMLESLKPMVVTTMLAAKMSTEVMPGYDPSNQLDSYFFKTGAKEGKKILALETPEFQGEVLFNKTPLTVQAEALIDMLKNPEKSVETSRHLSEAYQKRDLNAMLEMSKDEDGHPEFMKQILFERNSNWMEKLPAIIDETPSFIVVGALHLAGPEGLLQALSDLGYTLTPVY